MTTGKNKYYKQSHISERKFRELLRCFALDLNAKESSQLTGISHVSCKLIYTKLRLRIVKQSVDELASDGVYELDESYFGAKRVRGKRGRGAAGKTPVFGLLKRNGNVHVEIVQNCSKSALIYRVFHSQNEFARGKCHVNGIESFWSFAKRRLAQFNGLSDQTFYLHLKECEWRFNLRTQNIYAILLKELRKNPL